MSQLIEIPWQSIPPETLTRLIEEFVTRDGTDYGEYEVEISRKVEQVKSGLKSKRMLIVFNEDEEQTTIVDAEQWRMMNNQ